MARGKVPNLCRHKAQKRGYITWQKKEIYIPGHWPDDQADCPPPEIDAAYRVLLGQLLIGVEIPQATPRERQLDVLALATEFGKWMKDRSPHKEWINYRVAWNVLVECWGLVAIKDFGPAHLHAIQDRLLIERKQVKQGDQVIEKRRTRQGVNKIITMIKRIFNWGLERIPNWPPGVCERLRVVKPIRLHHPLAIESKDISPVPDDVVEKTLEKLRDPVRSMVKLQKLSGMRPGEVCRMTGRDLDRKDPECWWYRPKLHKTAWRGKTRSVPLVGEALRIVKERLKANPDLAIFVPLGRGGKERSGKYQVSSYDQAISRACLRAGVESWSPNQLRKNAAQTAFERADMQSAADLLGNNVEVARKHYTIQAEGRAKAAALTIAKVIPIKNGQSDKRKKNQ